MEAAASWIVKSIVPEPRMPHNINREFTVTLTPGGTVTGVESQRPAFAKVRSFEVVSSSPGEVAVQVRVHGMSAGTLNVPFTITLEEGEAVFTIRVIG